jgi:hypothetical protein
MSSLKPLSVTDFSISCPFYAFRAPLSSCWPVLQTQPFCPSLWSASPDPLLDAPFLRFSEVSGEARPGTKVHVSRLRFPFGSRGWNQRAGPVDSRTTSSVST